MCLCVKQTTPHYLSVDVKGRAEWISGCNRQFKVNTAFTV
jgi:hypothetical protein